MTHKFLSLDMNLIPQSTKNNVPNFWDQLFSNDNSRLLIPGKNENGNLVHPQDVLLSWFQWSENPEGVIQSILASAIEYTKEDFEVEKIDINTIWYVEGEGLS